MNTQPEHKAIATWMESLGFKIRHTDMYEHDDLSRLFNEEEAAFFYNAHLAAVAEAVKNAQLQTRLHVLSMLKAEADQTFTNVKQTIYTEQQKAWDALKAYQLTSPNHKGAPHE